jgi:hypothetical protein
MKQSYQSWEVLQFQDRIPRTRIGFRPRSATYVPYARLWSLNKYEIVLEQRQHHGVRVTSRNGDPLL